jgi:hypothetical protein
VTGDWRRLQNEDLHDLYCSPSITGVIKSKRMREVDHVARVGEDSYIYRVLVEKYEGKRPLLRQT